RVACWSRARLRTKLLSAPSSRAHFRAAAWRRLPPQRAFDLSPRSSPALAAATIAPVAESMAAVICEADDVVSPQSTPALDDCASAFAQPSPSVAEATAILLSRRAASCVRSQVAQAFRTRRQ